MAFVHLPLTSIEGRRNILDACKNLLVSAGGWSVYQDLTLETLYGYVMRSRGAAGTAFPIYLYMKLNATTTRIDFWACRGWNTTTKAGTQYWTQEYVLIASDMAWANVIGSANEDSCAFFIMDGSSRFSVASFNLMDPWKPIVAHGVLQSNVTSGTDQVLQLAAGQADNFVAGKRYAIIDEISRNWVTVSAVDTVNHRVTATISYNFNVANFAMIGDFPDRWVGAPQRSTSRTTVGMQVNTSGTTNVLTAVASTNWFLAAWADPDSLTNLFMLFPIPYGQAAGQAFCGHAVPQTVWRWHGWSLTNYHTLAVDSRDTGTSTGSNGAATLNDTGKAWTINEFTNKACIITAGTGVGQIGKISSNTATQITVSANWGTVPDATSEYEIADEGWVYLCVYANAASGRFLRVV